MCLLGGIIVSVTIRICTELNNLVKVYPEKVKALKNTYQEWEKKVGVVPWAELEKNMKKGADQQSR